MDNSTTSKPSKPQFGPYQTGVQKALQKAGEQQALEAISQGVPPQHIEQQSGLVSQQDVLSQLLELSKIQVTAKPTVEQGLMSGRVGLIGGLLNATQGKGFNPMAQKTESLGFDNAAQLMGLQQTMGKTSMDAQEFPLKMQKLQGDVAQIPLQTQKLQADTAKAKQDLRQSQPGFKLQEKIASEQATADIGIVQEARKTFLKDSKAADSMMIGLESLERMAVDLGDFKTGTMAQIMARGGAAMETFAKSPKYTKYVADINGFLTEFAKGTGEQGQRVSDVDIKRYEKALTGLTTPLQTKLDVYNEIRAKQMERIVDSAEFGAMKPEQIKQKYPRFFKRMRAMVVDANGVKAWQYLDGTYEEIS